jgi:hypothetical protein
VSNDTDPKREHDYEIVLKPVLKGQRFQDGKGMKAERQV